MVKKIIVFMIVFFLGKGYGLASVSSFRLSILKAIEDGWALYRTNLKKVSGLFAVEVRTLPEGRIILQENNHLPLIPASLTKIFTSVAALEKLEADYYFMTEFRGPAINGGIVPGDISVFSNGNPLWLSKDVKDCVENFVKFSKVRAIKGSIRVDQRYFSPPVEQLCLDGKCYKSYNPTISPVAIDFNTFTLTIYPGKNVGAPPSLFWGSVPCAFPVSVLAKTVSARQKTNLSLRISSENPLKAVLSGQISLKDKNGVVLAIKLTNPSGFIAASVRSALINAGVSVGETYLGGEKEERLYSCRGSKLSEVLHGINKHSNNFMAEMVFRSLGAELFGPPGTKEKGARAVSQVLREIGVPSGEFYIDSGSGLSYTTKASAYAFGTVLTYAFNKPSIREPFIDSLAENGKSGTLRRHWAGSSFTVKGKTGTLASVVGFSGYVFWDSVAPPFIVTFICNDVSQPWKARQIIDEFISKIVHLARVNR